MAKHKEHKSKKSKKHKKKSKKQSSDSELSVEEIVWTESRTTEEPVEAGGDDPEDSSQDAQDWLNVIDKSTVNSKQSLINRQIKKAEDDAAQNKIRYARELNSFYRDDVNRKFIEEPEKHWKSEDKDKEESGSESPDNAKFTLSDAERNSINAKIIKAEMLGDTELVEELKLKLKQAESDSNEEKVYYSKKSSSKSKEEEKMSVKELYFQTKSITSRDEAMRFVSSTSKFRSADDEYEDLKRKRKKVKLDTGGFERIRPEDSSTCHDCFGKSSKHLLLKLPHKLAHCCVAFTPYEPFIANCLQIRSANHSANSSLGGEEACWTEIRQLMRSLATFFDQYYGCCLVFLETHFIHQKRQQNISRKHFVIECVPLKKKLEADLKIFFHKAIMECGEEWSMNKKLIKLEGKQPSRMIPKGLAYFWVSIGPNFDGFAHVIEDEDYFRKDFGKEIIGGLRDIEPSRWTRPKRDSYDSQIKRMQGLKSKWNEFVQQEDDDD